MSLKRIHAILCLTCCLFFSGCSNITYYLQSVKGHSEILLKRDRINAVLQETTDENLRYKLNLVNDLLQFANDELLLPNHGSYQHYTDIKRPFVVWNVFATPELSLTPNTWCYLFVGCLSYRGYFKFAEAKKLADRLSEEGMDVYVGGVSAYSTLGWLDDPILNTMLRYDDLYLARLIFHELSHQKIYLKNDSEFNEAFADSIALVGLNKWLSSQQPNDSRYQSLIQEQRYETEFVALLLEYKQKLDAVYTSKLPLHTKRAQKEILINHLHTDYKTLSKNWNGYNGFDNWFKKPINNARFSAISTYRELVPAFIDLYKSLNNDLQMFYDLISRMSDCSAAERRNILKHHHEMQLQKPLCQ